MTATTPTEPLAELATQGISLWLDDLSRQRLTTGNLLEIIGTKHIVGVTTNPSIFAAALSDESYEPHIEALADRGASVDAAVRELTTDDVRAAADPFAGVYHRSGGVDGRVSIEVDPRLAHDTDATIEQAKELFKIVDRNNVLIKIPATLAGLPEITAAIAEGISVNVTLIFSLDRYPAVIDAYIEGLEQAKANGHNLSHIHSVASFFVSRVDLEIDKRLRPSTPRRPPRFSARPRSPTPGWPTSWPSRRSPATVGPRSLGPARTRNAPCGHPPESRTPPTTTPGTSSSSSPTAPSAATPSTAPTRSPPPSSPLCRRWALTSRTSTRSMETEGVQKFEQAWTQLLTSVNATLQQATAK